MMERLEKDWALQMRGLIAPNLNIFLSSVKYFCVVLLTNFEEEKPGRIPASLDVG